LGKTTTHQAAMQMHRNALMQNGLARIVVDLASVLDLRLSNHLRSSGKGSTYQFTRRGEIASDIHS
jgi:hypothetical protein